MIVREGTQREIGCVSKAICSFRIERSCRITIGSSHSISTYFSKAVPLRHLDFPKSREIAK